MSATIIHLPLPAWFQLRGFFIEIGAEENFGLKIETTVSYKSLIVYNVIVEYSSMVDFWIINSLNINFDMVFLVALKNLYIKYGQMKVYMKYTSKSALFLHNSKKLMLQNLLWLQSLFRVFSEQSLNDIACTGWQFTGVGNLLLINLN